MSRHAKCCSRIHPSSLFQVNATTSYWLSSFLPSPVKLQFSGKPSTSWQREKSERLAKPGRIITWAEVEELLFLESFLLEDLSTGVSFVAWTIYLQVKGDRSVDFHVFIAHNDHASLLECITWDNTSGLLGIWRPDHRWRRFETLIILPRNRTNTDRASTCRIKYPSWSLWT